MKNMQRVLSVGEEREVEVIDFQSDRKNAQVSGGNLPQRR